MAVGANLELVRPSISRFLARVRERFPIEAVYVFGSYAADRAHEDSDIDLAIISSKFSGNRFEDNSALGVMTWGIDTRIEAWGFRPEDFNEERIIVSEILKTGVRIEPEPGEQQHP